MRNPMLTTIVAACVLAGCATNPLIPINAPGLAVPAKDEPMKPDAGQPMSLYDARNFALNVRAEYREQMRKQIDQSQWLNSGLLLLGASVIGLAAGGANTNIILGTSLLGGTGYALGTMNLDKRRLLVLSAGIRALDCANSAVLPLDVGKLRRDQLVTATQGLRSAMVSVRTDRAAVQSVLDAVAKSDKPDEVAAQAALISTDTALTEADKSLRAAEKLTNDIDDAGKRLQQTVLEITQKVDTAMTDTLVDISAIPQLVAGLGGFASAFAPGAGVDKLFAAKLSQFDKAVAKAGTGSDLSDPMAALKRSSAELQRQVNEVNALIAGVDGSAVISALKACDVTGVAFAMTVEPAALSFKAKVASSQGFAIGGGTKPYTVRALDAFPDALSIGFDGGLSDIAQVRLSTADVDGGPFHVLVGDSSNPRRTQKVEVTITAAGKAGASEGAKPAATLEELGQALLKMKSTKKQNNLTLTVDAAKASADGKTLELTVSCDPDVQTPRLLAKDVRSRLVAAVKVSPLLDSLKAQSLLEDLKTQSLLDEKNSQLVVKPASPSCFVAG